MASLCTVYGGRVDELRLEAEENGWDLVVETDIGTFRFGVHGLASSRELDDQLIGCLHQLADWNLGGQKAAREHDVDLATQAADEAHDKFVGDA